MTIGWARFENRQDAGRQLAARIASEASAENVVVLALPRGGLPIGAEIAAALSAPLDVFLVRKLGAPFNRELAIGAIATGGLTVYNRDEIDALHLTAGEVESIRAREVAELTRRERVYRHGRPPPQLRAKAVIVADDGMATGATMRAAVEAIRQSKPSSVTVAVPTASRQALESLEQVADRVVTLAVPEPYFSVGAWYDYFPQLNDQDVWDVLERARRGTHKDRG